MRINVILTLILGAALTGCGVAEDFSRGCGGDLDPVCDAVFGKDADQVLENEEQILENEQDIERNLAEIEKLRTMLLNEILTLRSQVSVLEQAYVTNVTDVQIMINVLQGSINSLLTRVATLEGYSSITAIIDPCGDKPGHFDEVILATSNGELLAYFESGSKRFLTLLSNGNYRTTDKQRCYFTVSNGEINDGV
jgi:hypothetical protein